MTKNKKHFLYLDVDLVAQHSGSEDHRFGSSLELFAHMEWLLKRGAPLIHIPRIENLSQWQCEYSVNEYWLVSTVCVWELMSLFHLAMGVDPCIDKPLQYELGELIFQSCYCGVEGLRHLRHVCWHVRAEILKTHTHTHTTVMCLSCC